MLRTRRMFLDVASVIIKIVALALASTERAHGPTKAKPAAAALAVVRPVQLLLRRRHVELLLLMNQLLSVVVVGELLLQEGLLLLLLLLLKGELVVSDAEIAIVLHCWGGGG